MRIKGSDLKRIIKEEIGRMNDSSLTEASYGDYGHSRGRFLGSRRDSTYGDPMSMWARNPTPLGDPLQYSKDMDQEGSEYERPSSMMRAAGKTAKLPGPGWEIMSTEGSGFNKNVADQLDFLGMTMISGPIIGRLRQPIGVYEVQGPGEDGMVEAKVKLFPTGKSKEGYAGTAVGDNYWYAIGRAMGL